MNYCPKCDVWWETGACWCCGDPGTRDPRTRQARSWRNPATWIPAFGWTDDE